MLACQDVANYFLLLASDDESGELISNLKLQKLVYYAQGFHLAAYDKPLFNERIEAWTHGPVVPELYRAYKAYGDGAIPPPIDFDVNKIDDTSRQLLDEVYNVYGQFSAWKLRNMTHMEPPWRDLQPNGGVIEHNALKEYFKTLLVHENQESATQ
jgi:uncharacterized phage-associated protein